METILILLTCSISLSLIGQNSIYGVYKSWHIVSGHQLTIKPQNQFELTVLEHVIPKPIWTGKWKLKGDTLTLYFDADTMGIYVHVVENEFLIRTNLKEPIISDSVFYFEQPRYLFKAIGTYKNGVVKCEGNWISTSTMESNPRKNGEWRFYYPNGKLRCLEFYKNGLKNGDFLFYSTEGKCEKIEKWKKGKLKKQKNCT